MSSYQAAGNQGMCYLEPGSAPHTFNGSSIPLPFNSESLKKQGGLLVANGIRGTRSQHVSQTREAPYTVSGSISFNPTPNLLDTILTYVTGDVPSGIWNTDASAETLSEFGLLIDREGGTFEYTSCKVNRFTMAGRAGGLIECTMDVIGQTEATGTAVPVVSLGVTAADEPYAMSDCAFTLAAAARQMNAFAFSIDNKLMPLTYASLSAQHLLEQGRAVRFGGDARFSSSTLLALYGTDKDGAAASIVMTNGTLSLTVAMTALQLPDQSPVIAGPGGVFLPVIGEVRDSGSTGYELEFTNDSTV